jgi:glycosyltransferase involved in cell wall biosynthesis
MKSVKDTSIVIIKNFYPLERDPRLIKLLKIMRSGKYNVTYIGWNRECSQLFSYELVKQNDYKAIIARTKAPFGFRSFLFLPLWWFFVLNWLLKINWDIAHVVNFPSIIPAIIAAKLKNKYVVYDIEDTYIDQIMSLHSVFRNIGILIERTLMKFVDAIILVDEMQIEEFGGIPIKTFTIIYDSPPPISVVEKSTSKEDVFTLFYAGYLEKERHLNLEPLLEAVKSIEGVQVVFAGKGNLVKYIKLKAREMPGKIRYVGYLAYDEVLKMSYEADLLFSLRDPNPLVQKYICGSKFLEATMCGKPILVNKGTSTAVKVRKHRCGIVVDARNVQEIRESIMKLKNDKEFLRELANNAKRAYEEVYNWEIMRARLLQIYNMLLEQKKEK